MKKAIFLCLAVILFGFSSAYAEGISVDLGGGLATGPYSSYGSGYNLGAGATITPAALQLKDLPKELTFRVDVSYSKWNYSSLFGVGTTGNYEWTISKIPIFIGGRFNFHNANNLTAYGEAGAELSFETWTFPTCAWSGFTCNIASTSETHMYFGITPGVGVQYDINKQIYVGANARYHLISGSFLTATGNIGMKF